MDNVSVNVRLRPVRFAFMVRPEDRANLGRIFRINTCLWGGLYNPIIPSFQRVPAWWDRHRSKFESAKQIANGYLDYFEPDFVVEATKGIADGLGIDPNRVLQLNDLLPRSDQRDDKGHGQTVLDLYRKLYTEEFQFVRRHEHHIVSVKPASGSLASFAACLFGGFPEQEGLDYFRGGFVDAFAPREITLDAAALVDLYQSGFRSALHMGSRGLDVDYHDHSDPTLFVLDAQEPKDLLDYWNYRAVHRSGIAIPIQWFGELTAFCKEFITKNHRPLPGNPHGVMIHPVSVFSRSIPEKNIAGLHAKYLRVDKEGANALQTWYPPVWRPSPGFMVHRTRPTVTAAEKEINVALDTQAPRLRFDSLHPDFADRFGGDDRWANVVELEDWTYQDRIATVFPTDCRVPAVPHFGIGSEHLLSTTEGLVSFPRYKDIPHRWDLIDGREAINLWLKRAQISCRLSDSGRTTQQIIQTLGGFAGVRSIAHKGIIGVLDGMAKRPITRSSQSQKFQNEIKAEIGGDIWRNRVFETLVERKAVKLGYELSCSKCGSWSWYALDQLDETMTCDLCLQRFSFPLTDPSGSHHARWAYRVVGPFALPDYANGGYAAALAIRCFADVIGRMDRADSTWSPGQVLTLENGTEIEVDFVLWYQRKHLFGTNEPTRIVFGEAKSFGKEAIEDKDVERLKFLAEKYPGAALVFATLKDAEDLSKDEIRRIRKLAEWGRVYDRERRETRAPVIVLTGTELFAAHYLEQAWKEKEGKHKQIAEASHLRLENLRVLADATQQLYLGMPSYHEWWDAKWKANRRPESAAKAQRAED